MADTSLETPPQDHVVENSTDTEQARKQSKTPRPKPDGANECYERVSKSAGTIKILERLSDRGDKHVDTAVNILMTSQTTRESKVYQTFLYDILRQAGRGFVVLCAASLGKQRVVQLSEFDKASLVRHVKDNKAALHCSALESLADDFQVPSLDDAQLIEGLAVGSRKRIRGEEQLLSAKKSRKEAESNEDRAISSKSHASNLDQVYHDTDVDPDQGDTRYKKASQDQAINQTLKNGLGGKESAPSQEIQNHQDASPNTLAGSSVQGRPADQPDESFADFELIDILNFLQQYKASCPKLHMICPWDGFPLPSIDAELESSLGLRTKIELSHELGARFLEYILVSRGTAAEVPH